jgi:hypothetical protein
MEISGNLENPAGFSRANRRQTWRKLFKFTLRHPGALLSFAGFRDGWPPTHRVRIAPLLPVSSCKPILMSYLPLHVPDLRLVCNGHDVTDGDAFSNLWYDPRSVIDHSEMSSSSLAVFLRECGFSPVRSDLALPTNGRELLDTLAGNRVAAVISASDTEHLVCSRILSLASRSYWSGRNAIYRRRTLRNWGDQTRLGMMACSRNALRHWLMIILMRAQMMSCGRC